MFGNMALRAEMASMSDKVAALEAVTRDQSVMIHDLLLRLDRLTEQVSKGPEIAVPSATVKNVFDRVGHTQAIAAIVDHLGMEIRKYHEKTTVALVPKESGVIDA